MFTPEQAVQHQLDAYNERDVERFAQAYSHDVEVFRPPQTQPILSGVDALKVHYAANRFNLLDLHAKLLNRMVLGKTVIDHELIQGLGDEPVEAAAVYEVTAGLINRVWFFSAK
jgi:hypothetical protein